MQDNAHLETRQEAKDNNESKRITMHSWDGDSQRKMRVDDYGSGYCSSPSMVKFNLKAF